MCMHIGLKKDIQFKRTTWWLHEYIYKITQTLLHWCANPIFLHADDCVFMLATLFCSAPLYLSSSTKQKHIYHTEKIYMVFWRCIILQTGKWREKDDVYKCCNVLAENRLTVQSLSSSMPYRKYKRTQGKAFTHIGVD